MREASSAEHTGRCRPHCCECNLLPASMPFPSSACETESGAYTTGIQWLVFRCQLSVWWLCRRDPKAIVPSSYKERAGARRGCADNTGARWMFSPFDCLPGLCADRQSLAPAPRGCAAIVPAVRAAFPLCGRTGCFHGPWTPRRHCLFLPLRPDAGESMCSRRPRLSRRVTRRCRAWRKVPGACGAERAEVVPALGRVFREAAVCRRCLMAFSISTRGSLGPTLVSQRVPV